MSKKVHPFFCLLVFYLLNSIPLFSSPQSDAWPKTIFSVKTAYDLVLKMELDSARLELDRIQSSESNNASFYYVENLADALELFITEDPALYEQYEKNLDERLEKLENLDPEDPFKLFVLGELRLHTSLLNAKFGEELSSVWNLRKAYFHLTENKKKFPEFTFTNKSLGVLHILLGTVPEKYHWILSLLNMEGTVDQGIAELETIISRKHILEFESRMILSLLQTYIFQEESQSLDNLHVMHESDPGNILLNYVYSAVQLKNSHGSDAEKILLLANNQDIQQKRFHLYYYLMGEVYLLEGNFSKAISKYNQFLDGFKGYNFIKDVHYKMFLAYHLSGDEENANKYYELAKSQGGTIIEADKIANRMVNQKALPNRVIMKLRLATDGGYYDSAFKIVESTNTKLFKLESEKIEFEYRTARLYHKSGKIEEALPLYKKSIENNISYFGANSALQLGYIYMKMENYSEAKLYFEKALSFKRHEYKTSIDNKAIAALKKIDPDWKK